MNKISVIITAYKSPDALDLCLESLIRGQEQENQIIVVCDGFYDLNKEVLEKHAKSIDLLDLKENVGTCRAINLGVFNATYDNILILNDDNVAPNEWDTKLMEDFKPNSCLAPNQIEPFPSIFKQFIIKDLGRDPKIFDLNKFWNEDLFESKNKIDNTGSTFPIMIKKLDFLRVGGFDDSYPSQTGFVADCEFFLKCQLSGIEMLRTYKLNFYHFVSLTSHSPEQKEKSKQAEINCHEYFKYKWGKYIQRDLNNKYYI